MYKIGFDVDEVVSLTLERIREYLYKEHGFDIEPETIKDFKLHTHPLYEEHTDAFEALFAKFKDMSFFDSCIPEKGASKALRQLYKKGHYLRGFKGA